MAPREIGEDALAALQAYDWPGNVRQLRNLVDWLLIMAPGDSREAIRADMLPPEVPVLPAGDVDARVRVRIAEIGETIRLVRDLLADLRAGGLTILVSTPYMDEAVRCDRVALLQAGRILDIDAPDAIGARYPLPLLSVRAAERYRLLRALRSR